MLNFDAFQPLPTSAGGEGLQRRRIVVQGIVQGVGFRPFVYGRALHWHLAGFVRNDSRGVTVEVEGTAQALAGFMKSLREELPPLASIDSMSVELLAPRGETKFDIVHSQAGAQRSALISPDTATCTECARELFDPANRRYHYAFINCTNCGPRFTIIADIPYDRNKTTMRVFPMCPACRREYTDPLDRRFHAQPNACPHCGPQVQFIAWTSEARTSGGGRREDVDPLAHAALLLAAGAILAVKGLGGYHLACDALNEEAVSRLRQRKQREAKPFALMVPNLETARLLCEVNAEEAALLQSQRRPIVLLRWRSACPVAPGVAPRQATLGIMLPYTPLHHLLLQRCAEAYGQDRPVVLVMTSGNLSDEPIAFRDDDAGARLAGIADGAVTHNRDIYMRCDDTVMRVTSYGPQFFRRARGYVPEPLSLALEFPVPLLACGAHLKNTFCLGKGRQAFISQHIGDLENLETLLSFREGIAHFQQLFAIHPEVIAYDLHPEYLATKYALEAASKHKIGVQHHHAHIASVMAEHGLTEPVIGVAADGTGYGTDGAIWGCEIMLADLLDFERRLSLEYVPLPGGEQAVRQPWRMGAVYLARACGEAFLDIDIPFVRGLDRQKWHLLAQMITRGINCPQTSSLGRLFDAVAALLGLRSEVLYEGQAAIELEAQAAAWDAPVEGYPFLVATETARLDVLPLIRALVRDIEQAEPLPLLARRFHVSIASLLAEACVEARRQSGLHTVALSGGVFQNRLLLELLIARLKEREFSISINERVPPNDGGVSLGQAAVAAARLRKG